MKTTPIRSIEKQPDTGTTSTIMVIGGEDNETSISFTDVEGQGTSDVTSDHPFLDSFISVDSNAINDDEESIQVDIHINNSCPHAFTKDRTALNVLHASKKSSRSFGSSDIPYGESDGNDGSQPRETNQNTQERRSKSLIFGLLGLQALLVILSYSRKSLHYALAVLPLIGCIGLVFVRYESRRKENEETLLRAVSRSEAIVDSLFPEIVRDRILEQGNLEASSPSNPTKSATTNKGDPIINQDCHQYYEECSSQSSFGNDGDPAPSSSFLKPSKRLNSFVANASSSTFATQTSSNIGGALGSPDSSPRSPSTNKPSLSSRSLGMDNSNHHRLSRMHSSGSFYSTSSSKPIADYFPSATILFADIVGFTSWASIRDPAQVFELLETVYGRFDEIAKKKGVFKVETIGDCYVAATGLPRAREDHAVVMASFARRCLESMLDVVSQLETSLGPGTADLGMRFGIHSGNVIGGVLRGAKSRYQLFGDTINTASRIETSSEKNKIHLSEQTAELLIEGGKKLWVEPRTEKIVAKGKGELQTYWLTTEGPKNLTVEEKLALPALLKMMAKANIDPGFIKKKQDVEPIEKRERLVSYHTNVLSTLLEKIAVLRIRETGNNTTARLCETKGEPTNGIVFPSSTASTRIDDTNLSSSSTIDAIVLSQLRRLVSRMGGLYRSDRPFHSFEHASHVVLSITKLFAAVEASKGDHDDWIQKQFGSLELLKKTKSMITHPMTQFVVVFAALVHNPDDKGVQDAINDNPESLLSGPASPSIEHAWSLWMDPAFADLRRFICTNLHELEFFRRLLAKCITVAKAPSVAMDNIRNCENTTITIDQDGTPQSELNSFSVQDRNASQKAMDIIELLIQVSNTSHAFQYFAVFQKWNKLQFQEVYGAYMASHSDDPAEEDPYYTWYDMELGLFEGRIVLAKRLRDSGVFHNTADVYLNAAIANARKWQQNGRSIVQEYLSEDKDSK